MTCSLKDHGGNICMYMDTKALAASKLTYISFLSRTKLPMIPVFVGTVVIMILGCTVRLAVQVQEKMFPIHLGHSSVCMVKRR
jgi:hypothetical protein